VKSFITLGPDQKEGKDSAQPAQNMAASSSQAQGSGQDPKTEQKTAGEGSGWVSYFWRGGKPKSEKSGGNRVSLKCSFF